MFPKIKLTKLTKLTSKGDNENPRENFVFKMNFDGCSKGHPGLCGAGAAIYHDKDELWGGGLFVGR